MELQILVNKALANTSTYKLAKLLNKSQPTIFRMSKGITHKTDVETIRKLEELIHSKESN